MIEKISYIESREFCPYQNLAVEEYLLFHCDKNECILYLWQNRNSVVIGRNQNIWNECLVSKLEEENGFPVRRLSGGGTVYHDLGNLNFTFLVRKENYDINKQLDVILKAVKKLGIHAEKSGRNDILVHGHKFSGNAFYEQDDYCYHHGTLMVHVDLKKMSRYLTVSKEKLYSKGINSVKARVTNLEEYMPGLTIKELKGKILEAFEEVYELKAEVMQINELDGSDLKIRNKKFSSWDWIYGKKLDFQYELSNRFDWGQITLQLCINSGKIEDLNVYSDSMKPQLIQSITKYLKNIPYSKYSICEKLKKSLLFEESEKRIINDIILWLEKTDF